TTHEAQRTTLTALLGEARKDWHGTRAFQPDWGDQSRTLALSAEMKREGVFFYLAMNAFWEALEFELPPAGDGSYGPWRRWVDTALDSPQDIVPWQEAQPVTGNAYRVEGRSVVMLFAGGR